MSPPDDPLLAGLNPVQAEAVTHTEGPLLIVAGAGSGKTRVLTHRIAHLIRDHGISPFEILAITFTNKAADEMKTRVGALVGPVAEKMWVSTFHSACVRILRRDADRLGYPKQFTIYDQADANRLTGYVIRDLALDPKRFPPRSVHAVISAAKNDGLSADQYAEAAQVIYERKIGDIFREYQARLQRAGAMDFDDLLGKAVELLHTQPDLLAHYQRRFKHVLVDEYQDTNVVQNDLVLALAKEHHNVCVVGDGDQCLPEGTLVSTPTGPKPIETIEVGDEVMGTGGHFILVPGRVTEVKKGEWSGRQYFIRAGGHTLQGTPHHIVFADTMLDHDKWIIYLMHKHDRGWRIGVTSAVRVGNGRLPATRPSRAHQPGARRRAVVPQGVRLARGRRRCGRRSSRPSTASRRLSSTVSAARSSWARSASSGSTTCSIPSLGPSGSWKISISIVEFPHMRPTAGRRRDTLTLSHVRRRAARRPRWRVDRSPSRAVVLEPCRSSLSSLRPPGFGVRTIHGSRQFEVHRT